MGETYLWLPGDDETAWPLPTVREPGEQEDGSRVVRCADRATAIEWYRRWAASGDLAAQARRQLRGRNLACWCPAGEPCHADVLLELANRVPALR